MRICVPQSPRPIRPAPALRPDAPVDRRISRLRKLRWTLPRFASMPDVPVDDQKTSRQPGPPWSLRATGLHRWKPERAPRTSGRRRPTSRRLRSVSPNCRTRGPRTSRRRRPRLIRPARASHRRAREALALASRPGHVRRISTRSNSGFRRLKRRLTRQMPTLPRGRRALSPRRR